MVLPQVFCFICGSAFGSAAMYYYGKLKENRNSNERNKNKKRNIYADPMGREGGDFEMPFGKYQGIKLKYIPDSYIDWMIDNGVMRNRGKLAACYRVMLKNE